MADMSKSSWLFVGALGLSAAACLAPPPEAAPPAKSAPTVKQDEAKQQVAPGKPLIVWNGDDVNPTSKAWSDCDTKPCTSTAEPVAKVGSNGSTGLEYRVETQQGWAGFGWNFTSWYAPGAVDIRGRRSLKFNLQIQADSPPAAPELDALQVALRCAKSKTCNQGLKGLKQYEPKAADGQWHEITIPLADMKSAEGAEWDAASVWELTLGCWAPTPKKFVVHLDDIRFE